MTRIQLRKGCLAGALALLFAMCNYAQAQSDTGVGPVLSAQPDAPTPSAQADDDAPTMVPHWGHSRFLIGGQANIIFQAHGPFHSPYEGINSLLGRGEYKTSLLGTLFLGAQLRNDAKPTTETIL